jgi:O-antigen/teichoic acid export membrane protein
MKTQKPSLKSLVLKGASWTMVGVGAGQILRLGKSLILSRLLFPEAYGVMAIVWAVLYTLDLLSDVGVAPAIVRSEHGDDTIFLNTAWTMKVIRGVVLFATACALAYPISLFYNKPDLILLIPAAGLTTLIEGFCSTNIYSCQRKMIFGPTTKLDILVEFFGLIATLIWAYFYPSAWALVGGAIVGRLFHVFASHLLLPGIKNEFHWDRNASRELFHFGKWIFLSSIIFLLYSQGDRMILGKYFDTATLGVYGVAILLSEAVMGVISKLNGTVLYPALSRVANTDKPRLRNVFYRARLGTDILIVLPIAVLMVIGNVLVSLLYDSRYQDAGWMLQILCTRLLMNSVLLGSASCLIALGHTQYEVVQNISRTIWLFIGIPLVWPRYGVTGAVWVVALTEVPVLLVIWFGMTKHNLLLAKYEFRSLMFALVGLLIGCSLLQLPIGGR